MNTTENSIRVMGKDPQPSRLHTIARITWDSDEPWDALYFEDGAAIYRPVRVWCGQAAFGLVAVGDQLEVCHTHPTFVAYVQNIDDQTEHNLIADWRRIHNI